MVCKVQRSLSVSKHEMTTVSRAGALLTDDHKQRKLVRRAMSCDSSSSSGQAVTGVVSRQTDHPVEAAYGGARGCAQCRCGLMHRSPGGEAAAAAAARVCGLLLRAMGDSLAGPGRRRALQTPV